MKLDLRIHSVTKHIHLLVEGEAAPRNSASQEITSTGRINTVEVADLTGYTTVRFSKLISVGKFRALERGTWVLAESRSRGVH